MDRLPTLVIVAEPDSDRVESESIENVTGQSTPIMYFNALYQALNLGLMLGYHTVVVADQKCSKRAMEILPGNNIITLDTQETEDALTSDVIAQSISKAVGATPSANGWLIAVARHSMPSRDLLQKITKNLQKAPIAVSTTQEEVTYPIGFSSEMYSELIRLRTERELWKLIIKYPTAATDIGYDSVNLKGNPVRPSGATETNALHGPAYRRGGDVSSDRRH